MTENKKLPVITISREYGAGGRSVAKGLSERLGIEFYDRDFVTITSKASGFSEEDIRREGEDLSRKNRLINSFLNNTAAYISSYDAIYQAEREVILQLAKNPCIIVGRCSNMILKNEGIEGFHVFLYAGKEFRLKRTLELNEYGSMDPNRYLDRRDHLRKTYYRAYTDHEMGYYADYNICLDTGLIGVETCVDVLESIIKGGNN